MFDLDPCLKMRSKIRSWSLVWKKICPRWNLPMMSILKLVRLVDLNKQTKKNSQCWSNCRPNRIHRYHQIDSAKASITMSCINLKKCISISHKQKTQANVWRIVKFVPVKVEFFGDWRILGSYDPDHPLNTGSTIRSRSSYIFGI